MFIISCVYCVFFIVIGCVTCGAHDSPPTSYNWTLTLDGYSVKWCTGIIFRLFCVEVATGKLVVVIKRVPVKNLDWLLLKTLYSPLCRHKDNHAKKQADMCSIHSETYF